MISTTLFEIGVWMLACFVSGFVCALILVWLTGSKVKQDIADKKEQLTERCITGGQIIGLNGYIPCGKKGRK